MTWKIKRALIIRFILDNTLFILYFTIVILWNKHPHEKGAVAK